MKKYSYNFWKVLLTIICFPYIYFKSKKAIQEFKIFSNNFLRQGIDPDEGVEINSFAYHELQLKEMKMPPTYLPKAQVNEQILITELGQISYLKVINPNSHKWVIGLHGWSENKFLALRLVEHFYHQGYNILTFDAFGHGKTVGIENDWGYSSIPLLDELIQDLLKNHQVDYLGLIGNSMGASTAILYSQKGKYQKEVNWIIADCGFDSLTHFLRYSLEMQNKKKWWQVSFNAQNVLYKKTGVNHDHYNLVKRMSQNALTPIFFTHSKADLITLWQMSQEMFNEKIKYESKQQSELWLVEKANHCDTISVYYDQYVSKTLAFAHQNEKM